MSFWKEQESRSSITSIVSCPPEIQLARQECIGRLRASSILGSTDDLNPPETGFSEMESTPTITMSSADDVTSPSTIESVSGSGLSSDSSITPSRCKHLKLEGTMHEDNVSFDSPGSDLRNVVYDDAQLPTTRKSVDDLLDQNFCRIVPAISPPRRSVSFHDSTSASKLTSEKSEYLFGLENYETCVSHSPRLEITDSPNQRIIDWKRNWHRLDGISDTSTDHPKFEFAGEPMSDSVLTRYFECKVCHHTFHSVNQLVAHSKIHCTIHCDICSIDINYRFYKKHMVDHL